MKLHTYRYGEARGLPGLSLGVTRYLPRGVRRADYAAGGYFDLWLPVLAPSRELFAAFRRQAISFSTFASRYRAEMKRPEARQTIALLAAVAQRQRINLGCFCADASRCHRSVLQDLVLAGGWAEKDDAPAGRARYASPACSMPEIVD